MAIKRTTALAQKILELDHARNEYRQMADEIKRHGVKLNITQQQTLKTYQWEVTNLNGMAAGVWAAVEIMGKTAEVEAEILKLKEASTLKLGTTIYRSPFA